MKLRHILATTALLALGTAAQAATELKFINCGGSDSDFVTTQAKHIAEWEAANPDYKVALEFIPWGQCQDKSITLAAAGNPVAMSYMGSRVLKQLADSELIRPMNLTDEELSSYSESVLRTVRIDDKIWGLPRAFSTKALFWNKDLFEQAGLDMPEGPKTFADVLAASKAIDENTDAKGLGIAAASFDNTMHQFLNYLYSNGGAVIDSASGENMLDSKETRETLEFYGKLVDVAQDGPTAWERDQLRDLFNDGQIAMYVSGPWGHNQHNEDINQKVVPVPAGPSGTSGSILITDSIVVFKGSGHEDLAQELAKRITSGDSQYDLDSSWGLTPILDYSKLGKEDLYYADGIWPTFTASIATGGPEPLVEDFKSLQSVFTNMVQGIILKDDTVDNLVTIAAEELDDAL